jgi:uncharacterized protein (TIGR03083 family)
MRTRPLRQYYEGVTIVDELGDVGTPWLQHRRRLSKSLAALTDDQWTTTTRCTEWDARGVVGHLVTVDQYWVFALGNARAGQPPTRVLEHFNPSTSTNDMVGPLMELSNAELLERFDAGTEVFVAAIEAFTPGDWASIGESPLGHIPARYLFGHAFWDSWLHERDVFVPLGLGPPAEADEVRTTTSFALLFAGLQGGLLGDAAPVGPGPDEAIDLVLRFDEFPAEPLHLRIDTGVSVTVARDDTTALDAGSAVELVEVFTGRQLPDALDRLPAALAAQLARANQVL